MESNVFFETVILSKDCICNNDTILREVKQHQTQVESVKLSNNGGYQGHYFRSETLFNLIAETIPQQPDLRLKNYDIQAWVNINQKFCWNDIHTHNDDGVLISGVYYVSVPLDSGNIRFCDPRFLKGNNAYDKYYYPGQGTSISVKPKEKMILFFPPYLPHFVEPNRSNLERISIAFNILNPKFE